MSLTEQNGAKPGPAQTTLPQTRQQQIGVLTVGEAAWRSEVRRQLSVDSIQVIAEANFGNEALALASEKHPDVAIVGLEDPIVRSLQIVETLSQQFHLEVIVVSQSGDRDYMRKAMLSGARDFLVKPSKSVMLEAIETVYRGAQRRKPAQAETHTGYIISVFGGKGGIGKTTTSINLAVSISNQSKQRVALLDLDTQLGDVAVSLNLAPTSTIVDAAKASKRLETDLLQELMLDGPQGIQVLAAPTNPAEGESVTLPVIQKLVDIAATVYDCVIIDLPPVLDDTVITMLDRSTLIILVTSPQVTTLKNTKICLDEMLKVWKYPQEKVKVVVNHFSPAGRITTADVSRSLNIPVYAEVPYDPLVVKSGEEGKAVVAHKMNSSASKAYIELSKKIYGIQAEKKGLFRIFGS